MPVFEDNSISSVALHRVGNKATGEGYVLSEAAVPLSDMMRMLLVQYFVEPFKVQEYYRLTENRDLREAVDDLFADPEAIVPLSQRVAQLLYDASTHPNIKGGDLFVVYFSECQISGTVCDAVGLFKSEVKSQFLKVLHGDEAWSRTEGDQHATAAFRLEADRGIDLHKLDKGALIFNTEADKGYVVSVVDATNRGADAAYWRDAFLGLTQRQDEYYSTHAELAAYKKFVTDELPQQFEGVTKADQADLLNRSVNYFKQNDNFDLQTFSEQVIAQPEVIDSFKQYRKQYEEEHAVELQDGFGISEEAVKRQQRAFKSVIKLDKNFHIYVHGNRDLIEQGEDDRGKYYKVYYQQES